MSVYVDTSAFMAVLDRSDPRHAVAAKTWRHLLESREPLVTSNYVIVEMVSLLHYRQGTEAARRFVEENVPAVRIVWADARQHEIAIAAMLATPGKAGPSLVDCMSFHVIGTEKIDRVFAYDRHFEALGFAMAGQP